MTDKNTVTQSTSLIREGSASAQFDEDASEQLECVAATCNELQSSGFASITIGCWAYPTADTNDIFMLRNNNGAQDDGIAMDRESSTDNFRCRIGDATDNTNRLSATDSIELNEWNHTACAVDWSGNDLYVYLNGAQVNSHETNSVDAPSTAYDFGIGGDSGFNSWDGNLDECWAIDDLLTAAEICRVCSCGVRGNLCRCDPTTPANYINTGRNTSTCEGGSCSGDGLDCSSNADCGSCGGCTLPSCNAAAP